jgi:hypothetical protein
MSTPIGKTISESTVLVLIPVRLGILAIALLAAAPLELTDFFATDLTAVAPLDADLELDAREAMLDLPVRLIAKF